jgi:hypothetical protein
MLFRWVMWRTVARTGPRSAGSAAPHFIGSGLAPKDPSCVVRLMIYVRERGRRERKTAEPEL